MTRTAVFTLSLVALAAAATAGWQSSLRINGKSVAGAPITIDGKTYIPLSSLKAAGAVVAKNNGVMTIDFPAGGANQQNGVEGSVGDWLFNGIWRFKVTGFSKQTDQPGWKVDVEIRNGTTYNGYSPGGTGWQGVTLVLADGTSVSSRSDSPEFRDMGLNQGASNAQSLYFDTDSTSEPDRLILRFDPKGLVGTPLKFSVPEPSFRVHLRKSS